jgi:hypothetical protein
MRGLQLFRDMAARLRDDFEVALDQLPKTPVAGEGRERFALDVLLDPFDRAENVVEARARILAYSVDADRPGLDPAAERPVQALARKQVHLAPEDALGISPTSPIRPKVRLW